MKRREIEKVERENEKKRNRKKEDERNMNTGKMNRKRINGKKANYKISIAILMTAALMILCMACGKSGAENAAGDDFIEGELQDIMAEIYDGVNLDAEIKEAMQGYVSDTITEENEQAFLGTADVSYTEGVFSVPMMSSIAYQCVLLRIDPEEAEIVKEQLKANADLNKWVCVSAETVLVENVGDIVLFIMSDKETAYAVSASFQALKNNT